jgi:hypothetical protein
MALIDIARWQKTSMSFPSTFLAKLNWTENCLFQNSLREQVINTASQLVSLGSNDGWRLVPLPHPPQKLVLDFASSDHRVDSASTSLRLRPCDCTPLITYFAI